MKLGFLAIFYWAMIPASALAQDAAADAMEGAEAAAQAVEQGDLDEGPLINIFRAPPPPPRPPYPKKAWAKPSIWSAIGQSDYPISSWNNDEEGLVEFDLKIDAEGRLEDCLITKSSGFPILDRKACSLVSQRVEFVPAMLDAETPIASVYSAKYYWRKQQPELPPMSITMACTHDEKGVTSDCEIVQAEGENSERTANLIEKLAKVGAGCIRSLAIYTFCGSSRPRQGIPYRNDEGVPVAKRVTFTFNVQLDDHEAVQVEDPSPE
jgi:protein TonB